MEGNPKRVLIIDDDEDDVLLARMVISKIAPGFTTAVASSGEAGLAMLKEEGGPLPALILLDLKMIGMDGIELLRRVRGDERLKHIRVVTLTHSTLEADEKKAYDAGTDRFFCKSLDMEQFEREIKSVIEDWFGCST